MIIKIKNQESFEIKKIILKLHSIEEVDNCSEEWLYGNEEEIKPTMQ